MKLFATSLLVGCAAATAAIAQGVQPLDQTMRFAALGTSFSGPCGWSALPTIASDEGLATFLPDGRCTATSTSYSVCPGGTIVAGPVENGSGVYQVCSDGTLVVRWSPNPPGVDDDTVALRADGAVILSTRKNERSEDAVAMIGIALSSGMSLGTLNGAYRVVRMLEQNGAMGMALQGDVGTIQFDGNGGYVDQGTRWMVAPGGSSSVTYGPLVGTYTVDPDGTLRTAVGAMGALSPDGSVFFWMRRNGAAVSLTIGLRQYPAYDAVMASGDWHYAAIANAIGAASPALRTDWGTARLVRTSSGTGTLDLQLQRVVSIPTQTAAAPFAVQDAFALTATGELTLLASTVPSMPGALSADGSTFAALTTPGDGIGLALGIAAARWPTQFGSPTAGSGGLAPLLLTIGGFPYLGNDAFGFVLAGSRGGTLGNLMFAGGTSGALPILGGTVWLDPNLLFAGHVLVLSGAAGVPGAGAAAVPLPLPLVPELGGMRFVAQAFVLDPAAPQGVAMSAAVDVDVGR